MTKGDMVVVVGVMESQEETEEAGEEMGDQALVSKSQSPWSSVKEEDGGAVKNCRELTLW